MIKNLSPVMTGELLRVIDSMEPDDVLALVGSGYPRERIVPPILGVDDATLETTVEAIFSVLPLANDNSEPISCWLGDDQDEATVDLAFAVNGLACDAEVRRVGMRRLDAAEFDAEASAAVVAVRVDSVIADCAFLLRKGNQPA